VSNIFQFRRRPDLPRCDLDATVSVTEALQLLLPRCPNPHAAAAMIHNALCCYEVILVDEGTGEEVLTQEYALTMRVVVDDPGECHPVPKDDARARLKSMGPGFLSGDDVKSLLDVVWDRLPTGKVAAVGGGEVTRKLALNKFCFTAYFEDVIHGDA